jgi:hypothetical protein
MKDLLEILERSKDKLLGRVALNTDITLLRDRFSGFSILKDVQDIVRNYPIIGQKFKLSQAEDHSGMGMQMKWLTPAQQVEEAFDFYPGMIVVKYDYLPIGECLAGSGDPYFLKADYNVWNVYRVLHDTAVNNIYSNDMVEYVTSLNSLMEANNF